MRTVKGLLAVGAFALALGATAGVAQATHPSHLRLTEPLDVGGTTLAPGVYALSVKPGSNHNLLLVSSEDGSKVFATVLSVPYAAPATVEQTTTQYAYYPAGDGSARALRTWFRPQADGGGAYSIVYPEKRATQLAIAVNEPVVFYRDDTTADGLGAAKLQTVAPDEKVTLYVTPTSTVASSTTPTSSEREYPEPTYTDDPVEVADADELPRTASTLPLLGTLGILLLGAAAGLRAFRVW